MEKELPLSPIILCVISIIECRYISYALCFFPAPMQSDYHLSFAHSKQMESLSKMGVPCYIKATLMYALVK